MNINMPKKLINDLKIAYNTIKIKTYGKFNDESFNIVAKIDSEINLSNFEYHTYPESLNRLTHIIILAGEIQ